jgi:HEAT repeat
VLLRGLLRISATDSDPRVRQACAACLGELGAVDPSRLLITIGSSSSATGKQ